jgi:hypothetical protein
MRGMLAELRDVAAGLWLWRVAHPDWNPGVDWEPLVASTCVESGGEVALLDPIAPADDVTSRTRTSDRSNRAASSRVASPRCMTAGAQRDTALAARSSVPLSSPTRRRSESALDDPAVTAANV